MAIPRRSISIGFNDSQRLLTALTYQDWVTRMNTVSDTTILLREQIFEELAKTFFGVNLDEMGIYDQH